jgi:hypothetical protein
MILNSQWYDPSKKQHTHPCCKIFQELFELIFVVFGTASEVVKDCCGHCPVVPPEKIDPDSPFVSGTMTWITGASGSCLKTDTVIKLIPELKQR